MSFTESNTVEAHLRDLLAGGSSARPAQFAPGLARTGGRVGDIVCFLESLLAVVLTAVFPRYRGRM